MSILRKVLTSTMFAATILCGSTAAILTTSSPAAAANYSYGGVTYLGGVRAYTFQSHSGQYGNVVFFGAPPTTLPSHNGQYGNVTFLGGVRPYTYPSHSGQYGNVTYFGYRPANTVPVRTIPTPHIVRIH
ncbi:hypothetical protein [Bradyrhizobium lablabi]|uniref:hypothetical protein n=1 Tax=Bradyrhizobium lablabi TaxID=722472 RepID=UPI0009A82B77|nr:hypothetical protein [Bradyrhizobium lablabi]